MYFHRESTSYTFVRFRGRTIFTSTPMSLMAFSRIFAKASLSTSQVTWGYPVAVANAFQIVGRVRSINGLTATQSAQVIQNLFVREL